MVRSRRAQMDSRMATLLAKAGRPAGQAKCEQGMPGGASHLHVDSLVPCGADYHGLALLLVLLEELGVVPDPGLHIIPRKHLVIAGRYRGELEMAILVR